MSPEQNLINSCRNALLDLDCSRETLPDTAREIVCAAATYLAQGHRGSSEPFSLATAPYCADCDSPCEFGECDPPHLCRKHGACPKCNP